MPEAVLDNAIEQIADGLTVDWSAIDKGSALIFRVGALVFPAGFAPAAFAGNTSHNSRIAAEVVPIYAVAADLKPAARKLTRKLGLNWPDP